MFVHNLFDGCATRDCGCYGFGFLLISTAAPSSPPCSPLCYPVTRTHPAQTCTTLYKLCLSTLLFSICAFLPLVNISATYSTRCLTTILKCTITQWASARLSPTVHSGMLFNQAAVCSAVEPEQRQQRHILMCAGSVSCIRGYDSQPARLCPHCNAHSHPLQYQIRLLT